MATHATTWFGVLSLASAALPAGVAVVKNGNEYLVATAANRASYGRSVGVAITAASSTNRSFEYQVAGVLSASMSGVGTGTAGDYVIVSATGTLSRVASPGASDDIIGLCPGTSGDVVVCPCRPGSTVAGAPTGTGVAETTAGAWNAAATGTTGTGLVAKQTSPTFLTQVTFGNDASTFGEIRITKDWDLWWRIDGANVQALGVDSVTGLISLGFGAGYPIDIRAGNDTITYDGGEHTWELLSVEEMRLDGTGLLLGSKYIGAIAWDNSVAAGYQNVVVHAPDWDGAVGVRKRAKTDNTKQGIVNLAWDDNNEGGLSDSLGCTKDYTFAVGLMPTIDGIYAGGGGYRPNAYGTGAWCFGYSVFADGDYTFAVGYRTVAGRVTPAQGDPAGPKHYSFAGGKDTQSRGTGAFAFGDTITTDIAADWCTAFGNNCAVGANGDYAFVGGNQCNVNGRAGTAFGEVCNVTNSYAIAIGYLCDSAGEASITLGRECDTSGGGDFANAQGYNCDANARACGSFGESCVTSGAAAFSFGHSHANSGARSFVHGTHGSCTRYGEYVHAAHPTTGRAPYKRNIVHNTSTNGAAVSLLAGDGAELAADGTKSFVIRVYIVGSRTDAAGRSAAVHTLLASTSGGTLTIHNDTTDYNQMAAGHAAAISAPGGLTLRVSCNGAAGQTVQWAATVEWTELPGA